MYGLVLYSDWLQDVSSQMFSVGCDMRNKLMPELKPEKLIFTFSDRFVLEVNMSVVCLSVHPTNHLLCLLVVLITLMFSALNYWMKNVVKHGWELRSTREVCMMSPPWPCFPATTVYNVVQNDITSAKRCHKIWIFVASLLFIVILFQPKKG